MKIKDIRVHFVHALWRNFVIVRTETDDGIIGYGEGTMGDFEKTIEAAILDFRPHLIGREIEISSITNFLYSGFFWRGGPILMTAISAIEQSLRGHGRQVPEQAGPPAPGREGGREGQGLCKRLHLGFCWSEGVRIRGRKAGG